jgi:hypothetical protein
MDTDRGLEVDVWTAEAVVAHVRSLLESRAYLKFAKSFSVTLMLALKVVVKDWLAVTDGAVGGVVSIVSATAVLVAPWLPAASVAFAVIV